ncbi:hypothetical protein BC830DRAFT_1143300 [Chytriomyces sp. MP71]|nr:hypothetical protein BC830DRAFT_1143300 [Chytriomyces sp. MP71]
MKMCLFRFKLLLALNKFSNNKSTAECHTRCHRAIRPTKAGSSLTLTPLKPSGSSKESRNAKDTAIRRDNGALVDEFFGERVFRFVGCLWRCICG